MLRLGKVVLPKLSLQWQESHDDLMTRMTEGRTLFTGLAALAFSLIALCLPGASDAQEPTAPRRIGVLVISFSPESKEAQSFRQGLLDAGYTEGRDVVIEWRFAKGNYDLVPEFADDLVRRKLDVIVVENTVSAQVVKRATSTIPIVMAFVADPVAAGLVTSLARPGGNVTGLSMMIPEISSRRLQLLKEINPRIARAGVLWNPTSPFHAKVIKELKAASPQLGINLTFLSVSKLEDIESAISAAFRSRAQALYVIEDPVVYTHRMMLLDLVSKAQIPAIYPARRFVVDGGLISYGTNFEELFRQSAGYVDKILKGAKPADLPVEQRTKFDLVLNLKAAKALGLTVPYSVLLQTTEIIR